MRRGVGATEHAAQSPSESWCYHAHGLLYQRGARFFRIWYRVGQCPEPFVCRITIICTHTDIHTYRHAYLHTYRHTCIHKHRQTNRHKYRHACVHTIMHARMHACKHGYMHTCPILYPFKFVHVSRVLLARLDNRIRSLRNLAASNLVPVER